MLFLEGNVIDCLRSLPEQSVHCVITSPPYWGLRDYGVPGQIGLEPTPEEYVEKMVDVFREVRRVLRDDGTLWLNLGDSYAMKFGGGKGRKSGTTKAAVDEVEKPTREIPPGLKPKDLVGIPWSVAKALQRPYYAGRMVHESDRRWMAAMIDCEGTICGFNYDRSDGGGVRTGVNLCITNSDQRLLDEASRIWPASRSEHCTPGEGHLGLLPTWRWIVHGAENKALFLREVYPYLIGKKKQGLLAYNMALLTMDAKRLGKSAQRDEVREKRAFLVELISKLNHLQDVDIPNWCIEPPSCYEPGWYLRSDTIWAKGASGQHAIWQNVYDSCLANGVPTDVAAKIADSADPYVGNPMPESVTDRPTRSHEYIFLLTKSERYFYDHVAIQEDAITDDTRRPYGSPGMWEKDGRPPEKRHGGEPRKQDSLGKNTYTDFNDRYEPLSKRNRRDTWLIPTQPFPGSHFAVFPEALVEPCIKAGTSEYGCCPKCGAPWVRVIEKGDEVKSGHGTSRKAQEVMLKYRGGGNLDHSVFATGTTREKITTGWQPTCSCNLPPIPCVTLDPFGGSGTVAKVSRDLGRESVYIDLNPDYVRMAMDRVGSSLFNNVEHRKVN